MQNVKALGLHMAYLEECTPLNGYEWKLGEMFLTSDAHVRGNKIHLLYSHRCSVAVTIQSFLN